MEDRGVPDVATLTAPHYGFFSKQYCQSNQFATVTTKNSMKKASYLSLMICLE